MMRFNDFVNDSQAQACTLVFGCKIRVEDLGQKIIRNAPCRVGDADM
jgi:hypothetical protein